MRLTLISPRIALQKGDFLGSGIPYWPLELATLAAYARKYGDEIVFIDLFGNNPTLLTDLGDHYLQGASIKAYLGQEGVCQSDAFILYAISFMSHRELLTITQTLKNTFPEIPVVILENSQAVTAYSLQKMAEEFFLAGADLLICGEAYFNWDNIKRKIIGGKNVKTPQNVITNSSNTNPKRIKVPQTCYPIPAWDLVNLEGYWKLPYSHGPKTKKYLPVLTSRGCPYPCNFCVLPETSSRQWHGNRPEDVVNEIIALSNRFKVYDFQIEDPNPTVQHKRWERICELLIEKQVNIHFYFVSGTKAETVHVDKIPLFSKAGCRYISFSPETGGKNLLKSIGKKFDFNHGISLVAACRKHQIRTQACFIVGHPDEKEADFTASRNYLATLVKNGLDEVAVFVVASFAGSELYARNAILFSKESVLPSFSPKGRDGYEKLEYRRRILIRTFFANKLKTQGMELWLQGLRAFLGKPETKMENLPRRVVYIYWHILLNALLITGNRG